MSFSERLKAIQNLIYDDTQKCIQAISSKIFINSLFYQELKAFTQMFEAVLSKKGIHLKGSTQGKNLLRPQLVIAFYSVIIMRSNMVSIRQSTISSIATKVDQFEEIIFNTKMAIENLSKIYRSLEENDKIRYVIAGLLLKIKGFTFYKMIVKDLHPDFISQQTMDIHFEAIKNQCPNLLESQILKFKLKWSKYLKFKPISLSGLQNMLQMFLQVEKEGDLAKWDQLMQDYEQEAKYIQKRLENIEQSEQVQKVNIDELINSFDTIYAKISQKIKQNSTNPPKKSLNGKSQVINPQYDYKQFVLKNYIKMYGQILSILNQSILIFHINWIRKIKWLYNFLVSIFVNFNIKTATFHASVAKQYSKIISLLIKILLTYFVTFKNGLFPAGKLQDFAFNQQFSIYKLVESLLYNEYPFDESDAIVFQNYQKQRKNIDNKHSQRVIDIVNFSMNSLNINPHWDNLLVKLIPNLKNSHLFAKELVNNSLYILLQYFKMSHNYQHAAKLLLMLANAKNSILTSEKHIRRRIDQIKQLIYPARESIKDGIEYFCEEYFNQFIKINLKKKQNQPTDHKFQRLQYFHCDDVNLNTNTNKQSQQKKTFRKTQSRQAIIEGWQQKFESAKGSPIREMKASHSKNPLSASAQVLSSQIFYSVKDGNAKEQVNSSQAQAEQSSDKPKQDEILVPEF